MKFPFFTLHFLLSFILLPATAFNSGYDVGFVNFFTSGVPSSLSISTVDCFGNFLRGDVITYAVESSNPSFNNMMYARSQDSLDDIPLMQSLVLTSNNYAVSVVTTLRSSRSRRFSAQSWFLNGPQGLSSTYYYDCSWSVPFESLLTSIPLFRPIGSVVIDEHGSIFGGSTHPCSVQWSGLLRIPKASQNESISFELGNNQGSCLTLFINDKMCCSSCHSFVVHRKRYGRDLNYVPCKCTFEVRGSLASEFWRLSLYGNSDGGSPNWFLNWFLFNAHSDGFQPIQDSDVLPTSTVEHNITVFHGM